MISNETVQFSLGFVVGAGFVIVVRVIIQIVELIAEEIPL